MPSEFLIGIALLTRDVPMKSIGVFHVITDTTTQTRFTHYQIAEMAIKAGADTIQFRQKTGTTRQLIENVEGLQSICKRYGVPLIVNDRADIALAVGAAGVHLGQDDLPIAIGRRIFPRQTIIGASARTQEQVMQAVADGADYIGFGPIYRTSSKLDAESPKGLDALRRVSQIANCPVIAIGGVTADTAYETIRAGAHGVAVISAVCSQPDPVLATRQLLAEIERAKRK